MLALGMLALAMTSGCFMAAVPIILDVARAAGSGISSSAHAAKNNQIASRESVGTWNSPLLCARNVDLSAGRAAASHAVNPANLKI